ncbi:cytochrome c oxidase assembly protein [Cryptosporangium phraense]|uniref:Cytochrome c oxidase assembly protein n=1 Tax=Cryptosporangium phraense TaxID=2593070 RepID=A0A545ATL9_9ACTN|nr:cytochrome c oxidase assembly protein [Cryptosporangium phraense]TQS44672.1 cytochrome c oxidase assembly protein [Cryptosporangium phraense]
MAARAAVVWVVAAVVAWVLTVSDQLGRPVGEVLTVGALGNVGLETPAGRARAVAVVAAVAALLLVRRAPVAALGAALLGVAPSAFVGDEVVVADLKLAAGAQLLHLLSLTLCTGALGALLLRARSSLAAPRGDMTGPRPAANAPRAASTSTSTSAADSSAASAADASTAADSSAAADSPAAADADPAGAAAASAADPKDRPAGPEGRSAGPVVHPAGSVERLAGPVDRLAGRRNQPAARGTRSALRHSDLQRTAERYSRLSLIAVPVALATGILHAILILAPSDTGLDSAYGRLAALELLALAVVAAIGRWHRTQTIPAIGRGLPGPFLRFAVLELVVLGAATGLTVALSRVPAPLDSGAGAPHHESAGVQMLGFDLPPVVSVGTLATSWTVDLVWLLLCAAAVVGYLRLESRAHRAGIPWPARRGVSWLAGVLVVVVATCSGVGRYTTVFFSVAIVQHLLLALVAPLLLVRATPLTLALRASHPAMLRTPRPPASASTDSAVSASIDSAASASADGAAADAADAADAAAAADGAASDPTGAGAWLRTALTSRTARALTHPATVVLLWAAGPFAIYFTPLFDQARWSYATELLLDGYLLATGVLLAWFVTGPDPRPGGRRPDRTRTLVAAATAAAAATAGALLAGTGRVVAPDWYTGLQRVMLLPWPWGSTSQAQDQAVGGTLLAVVGALAGLLFLADRGAARVLRAARIFGRRRRDSDNHERSRAAAR